MDIIKLTEEHLDVNSIFSQVLTHSMGAVSLFVGTTRDNFEGKKVLRLEYEAFIPMAEKELKKICQSIREKWKVEHIAIFHRLGLVPVGEASVVVAISSEHRVESLEAVHFGIDTLKKFVPIWKKEIYDKGDAEWKSNKECPWTSQGNYEIPHKKQAMDYNSDCIQIKASNAELEKRMSAFMDRKRAEADITNIQEFCHRLPLNETENSCARTESILISRKDSKSHFKVSRVVNAWGPQTHSESVNQTSVSAALSNSTPAIQERIHNMEKHLGLYKNQPVSQDIYLRLKTLEDRILLLESTSPEYFDGTFRVQNQREEDEVLFKIDQRMEELRRKLKSN